MKNNSAWVVVAMGATFVIISIFRFNGYTVPGIVIALISVVAALISLLDILSETKYKKFTMIVRIIVLLLFIVLLVVWFLGIKSESTIIPIIGDSFTIMGFGIVILLYALKEIFHSKQENKNELAEEHSKFNIRVCKFTIIENEYEEMMKINDIIERLKGLDEKTLPYNRVHNGWAIFFDSIDEHWKKWKGPFFDGKHRDIYNEFLETLDKTAENIGDIADTDYRYFRESTIEMWEESITVTIQPRINNRYVMSMEQIEGQIKQTLETWEKVKSLITTRYQTERAQQTKRLNKVQ